MLRGKNVVVGVTGGIAAYKAVDVVSRLRRLKASVDVVMTEAACQFVMPLTFQSISQNPVSTNMFANVVNWDIKHVSLSQKAHAFVVCPATANVIGKIANGIADDMLTTCAMAMTCPVIIAPAMNTRMYENHVLKENLEKLRRRNYVILESPEGMLACGVSGRGRMAKPEDIVEEIVTQIAFRKDLEGKKILITAGPTHEYIDAVRYITNPSSGKMGYALAQVAKYRGAEVTLVSGPVHQPPIRGIRHISVESAQDMYEKVMELQDEMDVIIKSAAVSDFAPEQKVSHKIKKQEAEMTIQLVKNPDILKQLGQKKRDGQLLIGFCMETGDLIQNACAKLCEKNLDFIIANQLGESGVGFGGDTNKVSIIDKEQKITHLPLMSKMQTADEILSLIRNN